MNRGDVISAVIAILVAGWIALASSGYAPMLAHTDASIGILIVLLIALGVSLFGTVIRSRGVAFVVLAFVLTTLTAPASAQEPAAKPETAGSFSALVDEFNRARHGTPWSPSTYTMVRADVATWIDEGHKAFTLRMADIAMGYGVQTPEIRVEARWILNDNLRRAGVGLLRRRAILAGVDAERASLNAAQRWRQAQAGL